MMQPPERDPRSNVALLFSGGLDSSILLVELLAAYRRVQPLYVSCGFAWQDAELYWARRYLEAIGAAELAPLVVLSMSLADVYGGDHWSITGRDVPLADDPDERVYLPGHNPLLLIKADVWCRLHGVEQLALGALASNPFPDASDAFFEPFAEAMDQAVSGKVKLIRPLATMDKREVMRRASAAPLDLTFSCLSPLDKTHCGRCNKCAERQRAFRDARIADPTEYAAPARKLAI